MHTVPSTDAPFDSGEPKYLVVPGPSAITGTVSGVKLVGAARVSIVDLWSSFASQVDEGETEIVNIRETDGRLGPLIATLVALGVVTLLATIFYWWLTRPARTIEPEPSEGEHDNG